VEKFGDPRGGSYIHGVKVIKVMNKVLRFFTCGLTGMDCAIVLFDGDEICVPAETVPYYLTHK